MKRHMQLIRKLLEFAENRNNGGWSPAPECSSYSHEIVHYHIGLCREAGYLDIQKISGAEEPYARYEIGNLTWAGHEALARLREDC